MAAGIAELAAGWVLDGRTAQLPALQAPLVELILTPALGLTAAARAADSASAPPPAGTGIDDRRRLMDAVAITAQREGLEAAGLSDVAQRAGVELDVAHTLFTDELDVAVQALDAWAGQLVVVAAGAFLGAVGDPPLAAHQALQAAASHIARTPALAALAVADDPVLAQAVSGLRDRYIALFFSLIAGQVPATEQQAPQPFAALEVVLDGMFAVLRRFAREDRIGELTAELPTLSRQVLTPFFGADEAQRIAELSARRLAASLRRRDCCHAPARSGTVDVSRSHESLRTRLAFSIGPGVWCTVWASPVYLCQASHPWHGVRSTSCSTASPPSRSGSSIASPARSWTPRTTRPYALHRALEVLVYDMVAAPGMAYRATVELPSCGPLVYARHNEMLDLFCELLGPGFAASDHDPPDRETVALCIGGGVWETIRRHALGRRLHQLPDSLPALSHVCVSTFFGNAEAQRSGGADEVLRSGAPPDRDGAPVRQVLGPRDGAQLPARDSLVPSLVIVPSASSCLA